MTSMNHYPCKSSRTHTKKHHMERMTRNELKMDTTESDKS